MTIGRPEGRLVDFNFDPIGMNHDTPQHLSQEVSHCGALAGDPHAASRRPLADKVKQGACDVIRLAVEARMKRCGGEMRLVVPPDLAGQARAHEFWRRG